MAGIAARGVDNILRTPSQLEYATTRQFFATEVTPITASATIHSSRLKLNCAMDLDRIISFAAQRSETGTPKSAEAIELVLRGEATSKRLSWTAVMADARKLFETVLKLPSDNGDALAGVATTDIFEVMNQHYPNGNEQRRELAEPLCHARSLSMAGTWLR